MYSFIKPLLSIYFVSICTFMFSLHQPDKVGMTEVVF